MSENDLSTLLALFKRERKKMIPIVAAISAMGGGLVTAGATFINWHDKSRDSAAHEIKQDEQIVAIQGDVKQLKGLSSDVKLLTQTVESEAAANREFRAAVLRNLK